MPTTKKRINITVNPEVEAALDALASRDDVPVARKASELITLALELHESELLYQAYRDRIDTQAPDAAYINHDDLWNSNTGTSAHDAL